MKNMTSVKNKEKDSHIPYETMDILAADVRRYLSRKKTNR
jgi:hypothetical protein